MKNKKFEISKEELYDLYIVKNMTMLEIANEKGTTLKIIRNRLEKNNIKKDKEMINKRNKELLLKKYGVENVSQLKNVKEKKKEKSLKKYGVDNVSKASEIKAKKENKSIEKYGVKCVLQAGKIKEKIKKTNNRKYGVDNPSQNKEIQNKIKETSKKRYGTEYPCQSEKIKAKIRKTNMNKYGVGCVFQAKEIKEKILRTNLNKYGKSYVSQVDNVKDKKINTNLLKYGVPYTCMTEKCRKSNKGAISKINKIFSEKLNSNGIKNKLEFNLGKFSYDIEILKSNILIEINPTYTHNVTYGSQFKGYKKEPLDKNYHYNKTKFAKAEGYRCINIFDWDNENKIISMLKPKGNIYARKLECKEISQKECDTFLNEYHLQGSCKGQEVKLGLFKDNELVEVMTFGKPRYNKNFEWELLRLCSKEKYKIVGGSEKIFNYFIKKYNPKSIISYCDNSKFSGNVYKILGFSLLNYGKPSKHWYNMKTKQHITDNLLRQRGFDQLFKTTYGKGTSNENLMLKNGFVEIYDCGQSTYIYNSGEKEKM